MVKLDQIVDNRPLEVLVKPVQVEGLGRPRFSNGGGITGVSRTTSTILISLWGTSTRVRMTFGDFSGTYKTQTLVQEEDAQELMIS